jgi:hypothetical protein
MKEIITGLLGLALITAAAVGWVLNIIAIFAMTNATPLGWVVGRILGVFLPFIGAICGYF